jgi:hypothetical protein
MGLLDDAIREHLDLRRQRGADPGEIERLEREALGPVRREPTARSMGSAPDLDVQVEPEHHFDPPTELLHTEARTQQPKRGFLRRNRSAPVSEPTPSDFTDHLDAGLHGDPDALHGEHFEHPDPFGQDQFDLDDPFPDDQPVAHGGPSPAAPPVPPVSPVLPEEEAEPPHLIFDSAPPPRPRFAPAPASPAEPDSESAPADAAEPAPEAGVHPVADVEPTAPPVPAPAEPAPDARARADAARETREWSVEEAFAAEDGGEAAPAAEPAEEDVLEETPEFLQDTPDHDRLWFEQRPPRDFDFDG